MPPLYNSSTQTSDHARRADRYGGPDPLYPLPQQELQGQCRVSQRETKTDPPQKILRRF